MTEDDFYFLKIGQTIWHNKKERVIDTLYSSTLNKIGFKDMISRDTYLCWNEICRDCSLEKPKKEKNMNDGKVCPFNNDNTCCSCLIFDAGADCCSILNLSLTIRQIEINTDILIERGNDESDD